MRNLKRNQKKIYLCSKTNKDNKIFYLEPEPLSLNIQPLSTNGEIIAAGEDFTKRMVIYTTAEIAKKIHNTDRCYVDRLPEKRDSFCGDADYYVDGEPLIYLNEGKFYLQRMLGDQDGNE